MSAANLGGHCRELDRQILDAKLAKPRLEPRPKPLAADQAAASEGEVQEAQHPATGQRTGEGLEHIEPAGRVAASNQGADRRADNDIEFQAQRVEFPERANVGPAPRGAGSEDKADFRSTGTSAARRRLSVDSAISRSKHH